QGSWLDDADPGGVVIGRKLAKTLAVQPGGEIIVVGQASDGSIANELYRVRGILKSIGEGVDRTGFFMTDRAFRELMVLPEGVHEIVVMRETRGHELQAATNRIGGLAPGLEVKNWRDLQPAIANVLDISKGSLIFILLIVYTAIGMVVLNAMLMSVFERIREFGIMKAIGVSPWQIAALIYIESMIQVAAAIILAVASGVPVSLYFQSHGIDLSAWSSTGTIGGVALDPIWYGHVTAWSVVTPVIYLFAVAAVSVIYPTVKAAVIVPIKAIYYR
ncbi:MAG TPA: FtsX-like permease family protein, partial [Nitrospiria bacterium]|nr:FtsX-like permease family protein [Nitrospiria bacterium]